MRLKNLFEELLLVFLYFVLVAVLIFFVYIILRWTECGFCMLKEYQQGFSSMKSTLKKLLNSLNVDTSKKNRRIGWLKMMKERTHTEYIIPFEDLIVKFRLNVGVDDIYVSSLNTKRQLVVEVIPQDEKWKSKRENFDAVWRDLFK